ncbi:MAG: exopolysaccharide biosynthesis protein, partial [Candidatus Latescibacterota bacterium]
SFAEERHPRTAVGYSQNGEVLFLVVVDGRQPGYSVGMTLAELAGFMRMRLADFSSTHENAYQALNLDGGGSTTMVVEDEVVNSPSDQTGERPVANVLLVSGP